MEEIVIFQFLFWSIVASLLSKRTNGYLLLGPLAIAAIPALAQTIGGFFQKNEANNLKKSNYIPPELLMNRDLAKQQAYSRRAPGAAQSEERIRRNQANQIAGAQRMFGGDANKIAAVAAGSTAQANDASAQVQAQGDQFSENAFGRLSNANNAIAQNDRQNQAEYLQTKNALDNAGNTNLFSGINNLATAGLLSKAAGGNTTAKFLTGTQDQAQEDPVTTDSEPKFPILNGYQSGFNRRIKTDLGPSFKGSVPRIRIRK